MGDKRFVVVVIFVVVKAFEGTELAVKVALQEGLGDSISLQRESLVVGVG